MQINIESQCICQLCKFQIIRKNTKNTNRKNI